MINVVAGTVHERQFAQRSAAPNKLFNGRPGWQASAVRGQTVDEFDDRDSVYLLTTNQQDVVIGGWRLRPTTRPYMLRNVFPELLYGARAPAERSIWEISPIAMESGEAKGSSHDSGRASRALVLETIEFAVRSGVAQYVMVVSLAQERLLRSLGLKLHRFGPPTRIGRAMSVAVWLDVDLHTRSFVPGEPIPLLAAA